MRTQAFSSWSIREGPSRARASTYWRIGELIYVKFIHAGDIRTQESCNFACIVTQNTSVERCTVGNQRFGRYSRTEMKRRAIWVQRNNENGEIPKATRMRATRFILFSVWFKCSECEPSREHRGERQLRYTSSSCTDMFVCLSASNDRTFKCAKGRKHCANLFLRIFDILYPRARDYSAGQRIACLRFGYETAFGRDMVRRPRVATHPRARSRPSSHEEGLLMRDVATLFSSMILSTIYRPWKLDKLSFWYMKNRLRVCFFLCVTGIRLHIIWQISSFIVIEDTYSCLSTEQPNIQKKIICQGINRQEMCRQSCSIRLRADATPWIHKVSGLAMSALQCVSDHVINSCSHPPSHRGAKCIQ